MFYVVVYILVDDLVSVACAITLICKRDNCYVAVYIIVVDVISVTSIVCYDL